ncbi:MAG: right-handed parallel beta-helix repeat-containing protein [Chromatiales bacterium]|nr:right-handed parallel beta-helix repeat-containing protein [Chromatiales bacterium]
MNTRFACRIGHVVFWISLAGTASAVDGVIEINQARALAGGVTAGDTPGFPVTISAQGSYRLTSNLATGSRDVTALLVEADYVSVDLNGFTIACSFDPSPPTACTDPGVGRGVDAADRRGVSVSNGIVRDMGGRGIYLGEIGDVTRVKATGNGLEGIVIGSAGQIEKCIAFNNGFHGMSAGNGLITNSIAWNNKGYGIGVTGGVVMGNSAYLNETNGISASGAMVIGNRASSNGGFGLTLSVDTGYTQNVMVGNNDPNNFDDEVGSGVDLGANVCHGMACP